MVPRTSQVLHNPFLEVDTKSTNREKSAVLITDVSISKSTISSLAQEDVARELFAKSSLPTAAPSRPHTLYTLFFVYLVHHRQCVPQKVNVSCRRVWELWA